MLFRNPQKKYMNLFDGGKCRHLVQIAGRLDIAKPGKVGRHFGEPLTNLGNCVVGKTTSWI